MSYLENYSRISPFDLTENIFYSLNNKWMLIAAGNREKLNTMTASWGGFGILWNKPVAIIFIRPQRYTFQFTEQNPFFTLNFFDEKHRNILESCGSKSGREYDKVAETGLIPVQTENSIAFEQAQMILECKKLYSDFLKPENFTEKEVIQKHYHRNDFHKMYVGEIKNVFRKD
ncbi:MAG: flavin reductase [Bacteroidales bacterium]